MTWKIFLVRLNCPVRISTDLDVVWRVLLAVARATRTLSLPFRRLSFKLKTVYLVTSDLTERETDNWWIQWMNHCELGIECVSDPWRPKEPLKPKPPSSQWLTWTLKYQRLTLTAKASAPAATVASCTRECCLLTYFDKSICRDCHWRKMAVQVVSCGYCLWRSVCWSCYFISVSVS